MLSRACRLAEAKDTSAAAAHLACELVARLLVLQLRVLAREKRRFFVLAEWERRLKGLRKLGLTQGLVLALTRRPPLDLGRILRAAQGLVRKRRKSQLREPLRNQKILKSQVSGVQMRLECSKCSLLKT